MPTPVIHAFPLGEFQTNCFVITPDKPAPGMACWIVDCGMEPGTIIDFVRKQQLKPKAMLLTHTHCDHIAGIDLALKALGPMPLYAHRAEAGFCSEPMLNLSPGIGLAISVTEPDHLLDGGESLELDGTTWRVTHLPGHSPGGVAYVHDESNQAITGDTLFAGAIGRFDFPTSNVDDLRRSVRETLMELPDEMTIYPGHGPTTTIGRERKTNPYVVQGF